MNAILFSQEISPKNRLTEIDCAKGLAIILVVFGHLVMRDQPFGNEWYNQLRAMIYAFHMPFFMYLGGFVMFYTSAARPASGSFSDYIQKRAYRLLVPFFLMGFLIFFGKLGASAFINVDNTPLNSLNGLIPLFWNTRASPAMSLWYIFVIFIYNGLVPLLMWMSKGRLLPILVIAAVAYTIPLPEYVYLDKIGHYFVFFILGGLASTYLDRYQVMIDRWKWAFLGAFVLSLGLTFIDMNWSLCMAIVGTLCIPALHALVRLPQITRSRILLFLGKYSFVIYLFNTIMIGLAKGVMLKILPWHGPNFFLFVPVLFAAGLIAPILLKKIVFSRVPFFDKLTT